MNQLSDLLYCCPCVYYSKKVQLSQPFVGPLGQIFGGFCQIFGGFGDQSVVFLLLFYGSAG
jgi:hypothetical protein